MINTVAPRFNEGPRDWQNVIAISSRGSFSMHFTITGVKKIVLYAEDFVITEVRYIEVPL